MNIALEAGLAERFVNTDLIRNSFEHMSGSIRYRHHTTVVPMRISIKQYNTLKKIDQYLESHLSDRLRMVDISRVSCVSERTLERLFKKAFGITPSAYITLLRLHKARGELSKKTNQDRSIAQIAMDLGFTHLGRFSISYREQFGQSPSEFRQA